MLFFLKNHVHYLILAMSYRKYKLYIIFNSNPELVVVITIDIKNIQTKDITLMNLKIVKNAIISTT